MKFEANYDSDIMARYHRWHRQDGFSAVAGLITTLSFFALFWLILPSNAAAVFILRRDANHPALSKISKAAARSGILRSGLDICRLEQCCGMEFQAGSCSGGLDGDSLDRGLHVPGAEDQRGLSNCLCFRRMVQAKLKNPLDARIVRRLPNTVIILPSLKSGGRTGYVQRLDGRRLPHGHISESFGIQEFVSSL